MDRQKLSKVVLDHIRERERESTSWSKFQHRFSLSLDRFGALSFWERGVIAGTAIIVVMAVPAAIFAFSSGGGSDDAPASATVSRRTPVVSEFPTSTPITKGPTPKPIAIGGSRPTSTPEPNREDCDAIKGTPYQSDEERQWYADNCSADEEPTPTVQQGGGNPPPPTARPPTQPPPPQPTQPPANQGLTAGEAAAMGAQFLGVDSSSCSASRASSYWSVTCGSTRVCVFENPAVIDYC